MNKNTANDELDLLELILIFWKAKWIILSTAALVIIITFFLHDEKKPTKLIYLSKSKIEPISTFDEFEYEAYNSYLKSIDSKSILHSNISEKDTYNSFGQRRQEYIRSENEIYKIMEFSSFKKIDKYYLHNLFLDKLNENYLIINAVKKFNLVNKDDFTNNEMYENAVTKLASKIKLTQTNLSDEQDKRILSWNIGFKTDNTEAWENILFFLQKSANSEIQKYLFNSFNQLILNEKRLKEYKIEDIMWDIKNNQKNIDMVSDLNGRMKKIIENKDIERLEILFNNTPIGRDEDFTAAKMRIESTTYKPINISIPGRSLKTNLIIAGLFGAILAAIYALIANAILNRSKKNINL